MRASHLFLAALAFLLGVCSVCSHPQCLDFKPPFDAKEHVQFCPQYGEFGCCTSVEDASLMNLYMRISGHLISRNLWHCSAYIHHLICQPCSPYAAHIYDAEATGRSRPFPGLCENYCRTVFRQCHEALYLFILFTNGPSSLIENLSSEDAFCSAVALTDVDYCYPDLLTNPILNGNIQMSTVNSEGCLCVEDFASNLRNPVFMRYPEDGSRRFFVGEQYGVIYIYYEDKSWLPNPFLNISSVVEVGRARGDERGMLGIAFHPQYRYNKRSFLYYFTGVNGGTVRISEFRESQWNPNVADMQSERIMLEIPQPYDNHNGGEILFGDDGYLYLFVGDGGAAGDPENNSQNLTTLLGKVLRIDVDSLEQPYGIPPDNPFLGNPEARPEIYAYGVRNIWRCGKDRGDPVTGHGRGRIVCGDVGQSAFEEIHILKKGANYGWRAREGYACYDDDMCGNIGPEELPIHTYPHSVGKSVTGGHFYRGCDSPNLNGFYIYGDYFLGKVFRLVENTGTGEWENRQIDMCGPEYCNNGLHSQYSHWILSFAEDRRGEVYMLASASSRSYLADGTIYKIVDPRRRNNPLMCHQDARTGMSVSNLQMNEPVIIPSAPAKTLTKSPNEKDTSGKPCLRKAWKVVISCVFLCAMLL